MGGVQKNSKMHFIIDCSDKRNEFLYEALCRDGYEVSRYSSQAAEYSESGERYIFLFAPGTELSFDAAAKIPIGSQVFCVRIDPKIAGEFAQKQIAVHLYFDDELLAMKNAYLTAEGALAVIIERTDRSIKDMRALVLGGGRVGKSVAKLLHDNRCFVCVATIDPTEYAFSSIFSDVVYHFPDFEKHLSEFDLIVNTVPKIILKGEKLERIKKDCFIIDLASKPGGVDFAYAEKLGLTVVHALGIPGKTAPRSAGLAIKDSVLSILLNKNSFSCKRT